MTLTAVDLFSGCGGLTTGLKQAGFRVLGAVELDSLAAQAYSMNHPSTVVWNRDIKEVSDNDLRDTLGLEPGDLDLLAGCPPCQGFSSMRTLNGSRKVEDPRNDLVFEFLRFVRGLRPKAIMMENVPGLASDQRMELLWEGLHELGYIGSHKVLDTADYGVPQRRRRMLLLASRKGPIPFAPIVSRRRTVRQAIGGLPEPGSSGDFLHDTMLARHGDRVLSFIRKVPKNGGSRLDVDDELQLGCHRRSNGFKDVYGRMEWDAVAPTITGGCINPSKGRFLHPDQDRAITLREAALLQTFPRRYRFPAGRGKFGIAELIGNALPPRFIREHAKEIAHHIQTT